MDLTSNVSGLVSSLEQLEQSVLPGMGQILHISYASKGQLPSVAVQSCEEAYVSSPLIGNNFDGFVSSSPQRLITDST